MKGMTLKKKMHEEGQWWHVHRSEYADKKGGLYCLALIDPIYIKADAAEELLNESGYTLGDPKHGNKVFLQVDIEVSKMTYKAPDLSDSVNEIYHGDGSNVHKVKKVEK